MKEFLNKAFAIILLILIAVVILYLLPTKPVISDIQVSDITDNSAVISWLTNKESDSVVNYGFATSSYEFTASGTTTATGPAEYYHQVNLFDLASSTAYHYQVSSADNAGNQAKSGDNLFVTLKYFDLALRVADCETVGTDCEGDEEIETYGCALEGATVTLAAENQWNDYYAQLVVNSGEQSDVGDAPSGRPEWIKFKNIPVWTDAPDYGSDNGFYRITVTKDGYASKTGLVGIFGVTGGDLYWGRESIGNYVCLQENKPDLTVTDIELTPANPIVGDEVSIVSKVLNQGNAASPVVNIKGYIGNELVAYGSFGPLQPGATIADYSHNVNWGGPWTAILGSRTFKFIIDADNHAAESDETNNIFEKHVVVYRYSCTDSDGGKNYYVKGTVTAEEGTPYESKHTDYCSIGYKNPVEECSGEDCSLFEFSCEALESHDCDYGCKDGACLTD